MVHFPIKGMRGPFPVRKLFNFIMYCYPSNQVFISETVEDLILKPILSYLTQKNFPQLEMVRVAKLRL